MTWPKFESRTFQIRSKYTSCTKNMCFRNVLCPSMTTEQRTCPSPTNCGPPDTNCCPNNITSLSFREKLLYKGGVFRRPTDLQKTCPSEAYNEALKYLLLAERRAIPLQAWRDPEGSRRLRLPNFKTTAT